MCQALHPDKKGKDVDDLLLKHGLSVAWISKMI
jgi:hypothetical protein